MFCFLFVYESASHNAPLLCLSFVWRCNQFIICSFTEGKSRYFFKSCLYSTIIHRKWISGRAAELRSGITLKKYISFQLEAAQNAGQGLLVRSDT